MRCLFFMLGIVDSARFTPRGALRLNHLFGAGRFAMRASTLALALIRIQLFPPKKKASKFRCFLFLCEREWMRYRVRKPRFAPPKTATAPLCTLLNIALHNAAFCCIFENCPTPRLSTSFEKLRCLFLYRKNRPFGRFLFWFWVKLITLRSRRF